VQDSTFALNTVGSQVRPPCRKPLQAQLEPGGGGGGLGAFEGVP
jgi:hypothetical protein